MDKGKEKKQSWSLLILITSIPVIIFILVMLGSRQDFTKPTPEQQRMYNMMLKNGDSENREKNMRGLITYIPKTPPKIEKIENLMLFVRTNHKGLKAESFFPSLTKDQRSLPFLYQIHINSIETQTEKTIETIKRLPKEGYTTMILELVLHYKNDRQESLPKEIEKTEYSLWMKALLKNTANDLLEIVYYFKEKYPDINIAATSIGVGVEALIDAIDRDIPKLDKVVIWYPPFATIRNREFIWSMRWGQYDKERVNVITLEPDPTVPELAELHERYPNVFSLSIVRPQKNPKIQQSSPRPLVPSKPNI